MFSQHRLGTQASGNIGPSQPFALTEGDVLQHLTPIPGNMTLVCSDGRLRSSKHEGTEVCTPGALLSFLVPAVLSGSVHGRSIADDIVLVARYLRRFGISPSIHLGCLAFDLCREIVESMVPLLSNKEQAKAITLLGSGYFQFDMQQLVNRLIQEGFLLEQMAEEDHQEVVIVDNERPGYSLNRWRYPFRYFACDSWTKIASMDPKIFQLFINQFWLLACNQNMQAITIS